MIISVASGKGGTGKTTVATNLAAAWGARFVDCDVEEPNGHLFLKPEITGESAITLPIPLVNLEICTFCGACVKACRFKAIAMLGNDLLIFHEMCHGCGGCVLACPTGALSESPGEIGKVRSGTAGEIDFVDGLLTVGEAISPPLIKAVKSRIVKGRFTVIDCPPGTSCPVVAAVRDSDFCLLVTEPTPFGLHDLGIALKVVRLLGIPAGVVINRAGIGNREVHDFCSREELPVLLEIPNDRRIAQCYSEGSLLIERLPEYEEKFVELMRRKPLAI